MSVKIIFLTFFCSLLWGCGDNYFVEKEITYKDARITWYYRFLGDNRRDFVEVSKGFQHEIVMNCYPMRITDISIAKDSIVIKMHEMTQRDIFESQNNGFGIPVRIDPTATQDDFNKKFYPQYYKPKKK
jgi:hypothetical protein